MANLLTSYTLSLYLHIESTTKTCLTRTVKSTILMINLFSESVINPVDYMLVPNGDLVPGQFQVSAIQIDI